MFYDFHYQNTFLLVHLLLSVDRQILLRLFMQWRYTCFQNALMFSVSLFFIVFMFFCLFFYLYTFYKQLAYNFIHLFLILYVQIHFFIGRVSRKSQDLK